MKRTTKLLLIMACLIIGTLVLSACGASEAEKAMDNAVQAANELLEQGDKPYDPATKKNLEKAIARAEEAEDDDAYNKVTANIEAATKEYTDSVKQLKQVTNPEESFLIERAKTVESITDVEAATEETDVNKLMNKEGGYTSYIAMKSSLIVDEYDYYAEMSPVETGTDGGAVIEAFKSAKEAKAREEYLASFDGAGMLSAGSHEVDGTLLIRTSTELTATQQKELEENIIEALIRLE